MNIDLDYAAWQTLLADLARYGTLAPARRQALDDTLATLEVDEAATVEELFAVLEPVLDGRQNLVGNLLQNAVQPWLHRSEAEFLTKATVARLVAWYRVPETARVLQFPVLRTLAIDGSAEALKAFAELLTTDPPGDERQAVMSLVPLFQPRSGTVPGAAALFPRLFDALANHTLAPAVIDLANFLSRRGFVEEHPGKSRAGELAALLGNLGNRLSKLEESPHEYAATPAELSKIVNESVTLVVALCDALALSGDPSVVGKLYPLLDLAHRRVQTEAAAALAKLGEKQGIEHLKKLAEQPAARTRVLAYLEELKAVDQLDEKFRSPEARAQGDLAAWMAQPTRFGLAPDELELIDRTKQYWPGYVDPVECFLFTYEYRHGNRTAAGVALAGPATNALQFDLQDLPPSDIYALYAGLDAEHAEIFETPLDDLSGSQAGAWDHVREELTAQGYADVQLAAWQNFFGEQHAVATATHDGRPGVIIVADESSEWFGLTTTLRGFGPNEVYALYKGRKLLKTFNQDK